MTQFRMGPVLFTLCIFALLSPSKAHVGKRGLEQLQDAIQEKIQKGTMECYHEQNPEQVSK